MSDQTEPTVIDLSLFGELRTIQALRNSGVIADDATQTELGLVKALNHAARADYSREPGVIGSAMPAIQQEFRGKLNAVGYTNMVETGGFNDLLDKKLDVLVRASMEKLQHLDGKDGTPLTADENNPDRWSELRRKEEAKRDKYSMERDYYAKHPDVIKDVARKYQALLQEDKYLPIGKIVAKSGAAGSDPAAADDLVHDVMGVQNARGVKLLAKHFVDDATLAAYEAKPEENAVRITALAHNVAKATQPLTALREFEAEQPDLDRIVALKTLTSVQLHHAMSQERAPEQVATVERKARQQLAETTQAAMSLAYDFLGEGAASGDKRAQTIRENLKAEAEKDGITLLAIDEAKALAAKLARASAEDLLQAAQHNEAMAANITTLARAAGVNVDAQALQPAPALIGTDILDKIVPILKDANVIVSAASASILEKELERRKTNGQLELAA